LKSVLPGPEWWMQLEPQWKLAFQETFFRHSTDPQVHECAALYNAPALRFAGPSAPYPNMSFELTNLSGILQLHNLEILVVTHHQVDVIPELSRLTGLKSLFLYNNRINSLSGIEELIQLEQLYVQWNKIEDIEPVQKLINLKELYIHNNNITSLSGLTEEHADKLENLYCKPNDLLKRKELLRVERDLGIRCRGL